MRSLGNSQTTGTLAVHPYGRGGGETEEKSGNKQRDDYSIDQWFEPKRAALPLVHNISFLDCDNARSCKAQSYSYFWAITEKMPSALLGMSFGCCTKAPTRLRGSTAACSGVWRMTPPDIFTAATHLTTNRTQSLQQ